VSWLQFAVWLVIWIAACFIGEILLELRGGWMMLWGVAAYELIDYINEKLERK
jgi:hypothetical protein